MQNTIQPIRSLLTVRQLHERYPAWSEAALLADNSWGVTLENVTGHTVTEFYTDAVLLS